jgi:hypothetical protein
LPPPAQLASPDFVQQLRIVPKLGVGHDRYFDPASQLPVYTPGKLVRG